ncbi:hypothetical protein QAO71_17935 (plasmid) [Halopseudomonas sp. SMJS2]|uniref:hypothetical protein n=1 Tax=Halopseudomonas sp. SMJS2 TaxID=3041098 RepID=UPI0024534073|nr:hypothetical protein [Halopseudomonas sp. SMJS2]WGK63423.1 hypothetical protein QAO71_17935 [Halopseudomonas sp. SMJS2]
MKPTAFRTAYAERADAFQEGFASKAAAKADVDFVEYCDEIITRLREKQACLDQMFKHFEEVGFGAIFGNESNTHKQWVLILPDASHPGKFRYQMFGIHGWNSHFTCNTPEEVIFEACEAGCCIPAETSILDTLATTKDWQWGMERLDVITRMNNGQLSHEAAHERFMSLEAKYRAAA